MKKLCMHVNGNKWKVKNWKISTVNSDMLQYIYQVFVTGYPEYNETIFDAINLFKN